MEESPWEANRLSASQKIVRTFWNPNIHYRIYKCAPSVPVLSQINPVHVPGLISWRSSLILSPHLTPRSSKWSLPLRFPDENSICTSLLPHTCYLHFPSHSSRFDNLNTIWWGVQTIKLLIIQFSPLPCYFVPLGPKYSPQHPILKHAQPAFLP